MKTSKVASCYLAACYEPISCEIPSPCREPHTAKPPLCSRLRAHQKQQAFATSGGARCIRDAV
ncbi:hypothetical protein HRbin36_00957 [bacterium HR36]|nr:hypothetical protein HRbin36_00957 [bacterium HR36]